jgi:hypothetical protein
MAIVSNSIPRARYYMEYLPMMDEMAEEERCPPDVVIIVQDEKNCSNYYICAKGNLGYFYASFMVIMHHE